MKHVLALSLALLSAATINAHAETHPGKVLIDKECQKCHDNSIYSRPNSIIGSFSQLETRVAFCENASGHSWNDKQRQDVIDYLNSTYYQFPAQSK